MNMLERLKEIALDAGLDPDEALEMTVLDFMRAVAERRAEFGSRRPMSDWLAATLSHCDRAERTMKALVRERKAVTS